MSGNVRPVGLTGLNPATGGSARPTLAVVRRFYNPDLTPAEVEALDWANFLVVQTVQAFLGDISPNVLAVAVEPTEEAVTVHVALGARSAKDDDAVAGALDDLDALLGGKTGIDVSITYGRPDVHQWQSTRFIFLAPP